MSNRILKARAEDPSCMIGAEPPTSAADNCWVSWFDAAHKAVLGYIRGISAILMEARR